MKEENILHLHFSSSLESINGIHNGREMMVKTKEIKACNDIHVSFEMSLYTVVKIAASTSLYKVKK